jgi:ER membrane protein complex subunit 1, C-terminal
VFDVSEALYAEDAGVLDFIISTAGHGPYRMKVLTALGGSVIVSYTPQSCYVASRNSFTGQMIWRRNVCSVARSEPAMITVDFLDVATTESHVVTLEIMSPADQIVRGWDVATGALLWDVKIQESIFKPEIWNFTSNGVHYAAIGVSGKSAIILDVVTGSIVHEAPTKSATKQMSAPLGVVTCSDRTIGIEDFNKIVVNRIGDQTPSSSITLSEGVEQIVLLSCDKSAASVLLTSSRGTTSQFTVSGEQSVIERVWLQEEGLAQISSALMLDSSHEDIVKDGRQDAATVLQLRSRLELQWRALKNVLTLKEERRDHVFGFVKIAVMVSESSHRVYGIETVGAKRTEIRYQIDLPETAMWHRMIHGSINSKSGAHGINGRAHTRDILILSYRIADHAIDWICLDGTAGKQHAVGSLSLPSPIIQVLPLSGHGTCRQNAVLMLDDQSLVYVVDGGIVPESFYAHIVDKTTSSVKSFEISNLEKENNHSFQTNLVGVASFPGESLVSVAYPSRDEVIASPCDVLGDDSLLLKYLNPHLAVITSVATSDYDIEEVFHLNTKKKLQKRKPVGVSQSNQESTAKLEEKPNLFINVLDTVSGRLIYRVSHSNAVLYPPPSVLVSENWIFYTFTNAKTHKTELGVLTLYEGMIDKKSLSAFNSPEQLSTFSSVDARETTPVVLAKTFTFPVGITALGITSTRSGVSVRRLLLAGIDGQIHGVDRKLVDPRRPLGQLKDAEKKEGLMQYNEVIQTIPYLSLSYNQSLDSVQAIVTAPTDLESQSLVLAFGGPDIFFARTSPSRGFDLLPDTFNKPLLSLVVVALVGVLVAAQHFVGRKGRKQGWI